ncbi:hypothetical protein VNI00_001409 [Paramarasmius palmivorus]|uniref:Uncharacterized protein n=1 Tax=Paramarasmius palmivorus TaxID=297713 RepID=A0AAW0E2Y1_9AGAR
MVAVMKKYSHRKAQRNLELRYAAMPLIFKEKLGKQHLKGAKLSRAGFMRHGDVSSALDPGINYSRLLDDISQIIQKNYQALNFLAQMLQASRENISNNLGVSISLHRTMQEAHHKALDTYRMVLEALQNCQTSQVTIPMHSQHHIATLSYQKEILLYHHDKLQDCSQELQRLCSNSKTSSQEFVEELLHAHANQLQQQQPHRQVFLQNLHTVGRLL